MSKPDPQSALSRLQRLLAAIQPDDNGQAALSADVLAALRQTCAEMQQATAVATLEASQHRLLMEQASDAIFITDYEDHLLDVNTQASILLGYTRDELLQMNMRHLILTGDEPLLEGLPEALQEGRIIRRERRIQRKGGGLLDIELALKLLPDGRRQILAHNITERKQFEATLRDNELRLQALVGSVDEIVFEFDADGTYINIWTRNDDLLVRSRKDLLGRRIDEVLDSAPAISMTATIRRVLFSGQPETLEYPLQLAGGERWFLGRVAPIPSENSFVKTVCMVARDITERKRIEDQIAQNAAEIAALYRASSQLLNPTNDVAELAQHIAESVTREFEFAACSVLLLDDSGAELQRIATTGEFVSGVFRIPLSGSGLTVAALRMGETVYTPDVDADPRYLPGNPRTRTELVVPLKAGGQIIGVLDLQSPDADAFSERARHVVEAYAEHAGLALANALLLANLERARQAAEEANRLKSEFLANTSHELRTPLSAIMGALEVILEGLYETPADETTLMQTAYRSSQRLLYLIDDLLDYAKIEAGKMDLRMEAVDVVPVLGDVYMLSRVQADKKGLALAVNLPGEPPPRVWADASKMRQILLNLMGNAIKFTEYGEVAVDVILDGSARDVLSIAIRDTGIGIPIEKQATLFQPFVQVDGSTTRRYGGTGLGLSISRRLAELMGGALTMRSEGDGMGSVFTVHLPVA
jgi:PAS domain S-box-containing protein